MISFLFFFFFSSLIFVYEFYWIYFILFQFHFWFSFLFYEFMLFKLISNISFQNYFDFLFLFFFYFEHFSLFYIFIFLNLFELNFICLNWFLIFICLYLSSWNVRVKLWLKNEYISSMDIDHFLLYYVSFMTQTKRNPKKKKFKWNNHFKENNKFILIKNFKNLSIIIQIWLELK